MLLALLSMLTLLPVPSDDTLVARAKGLEYTRAQYSDYLIQRMGVQFVEDFVFTDLVQRHAAERGLLPTDDEVEAAYQEEYLRVTDNGNEDKAAAFLSNLEAGGYRIETWKARRLGEIRTELCHFRIAVADREITEEWLRSRYKDLFGDLGERVNLEAYFFSAFRQLDPSAGAPDIVALKADARLRAQAAREQLAAGAERATILAESDRVSSPLVQDGLVTGYRRLMLGKEIEKAVGSLDEPGETSPVVDAFDGSYVVRLVVREPVRFEDVQEELVAAIRAEPVNGTELAAARAMILSTYEVEKLLR